MKLYVGNLPWSIDDAKLKDIFSEFGEVTEAVVITDKFSKRSKGFGFVTFSDEASGKKAEEAMNGKEVDGRELRVNEAQPRSE
jgi:RNA recognition motif-containing protein